MVFSRSAEKCDASDIYLLNCIGESAIRFGDRRRERVKIAYDNRDRRDALSFEIVFICWDRTGKDTWMMAVSQE